MGTKKHNAENWYVAKIKAHETELTYEIPLDKEGQLILPEIKNGVIDCRITLNKYCSPSFCLECHDNIEQVIYKKIVEQRNKIPSNV
jgi:hypothetical protein